MVVCQLACLLTGPHDVVCMNTITVTSFDINVFTVANELIDIIAHNRTTDNQS